MGGSLINPTEGGGGSRGNFDKFDALRLLLVIFGTQTRNAISDWEPQAHDPANRYFQSEDLNRSVIIVVGGNFQEKIMLYANGCRNLNSLETRELASC